MAGLRSVSFECQTATPLFLGGADPRGQPELRAPSLRGALRYWFRALAADGDLDQLRKREAQVFGSQEHVSPLRVRLTYAQPPPPQWWKPGEWPPDSGGGGQERVNGLAYLGFAFRGLRKGEPGRPAIDAGWPFQITFSAVASETLEQAVALFWTLLHFGGLGSRIHRGFGSVRAVAASDTLTMALPSPVTMARTPAELAIEIGKGQRAAHLVVTQAASAAAPGYTTLNATTATATVLGQVWPSWHAALRDVGQILAEQRRHLAPSMTQVLAAHRQAPQHYPRAGFGLPIVYFDRNRGNVTLEATTVSREATTVSRRASPLWIRPIQLADGGYAVLLWLSSAPFLPPDSWLQVGRGDQLQGTVTLDGVRQFIGACGQRWTSHEVGLQ